MAKKKTSARKSSSTKILTPAAIARSKKGSGKQYVAPQVVQDFNVAVESAGPDIKNIGAKTEVLDEMQSGFDATKALAVQVRERWEEKVKREGKKHFECPFCPPDQREMFKNAKVCNNHIKTAHKAQVAQFKSNDMPEHTYTAKEVIVAPKRTMEDFVPPGQADKLRRFTVPTNGSSIPVHDLRAPVAKPLSVGQLMALTQSEAIKNIKRLKPDDLELAYQTASNFTKIELKRAIRDHMDNLANSGQTIHMTPQLKPSQRLVIEHSYSRRR